MELRLLLLFCIAGPSVSAQRLTWSGEGVNGNVHDMIVHGDLLIVGGLFTAFNGHERRNLQSWDGMQHYDMPGAFEIIPSRVRALEVFENDLIAAGTETTFGNIARWNGTSWLAMGEGLPTVHALAVLDGDLIAGCVDGTVQRWNGDTWNPVGAQLDEAVHALEVYNGSLYAGGSFSSTVGGSDALDGLARWSGSGWEPVFGPYGHGGVNALFTIPEGLVAVGSLSFGSQSGPAHWAIYDGATFTPGGTLSDVNGAGGGCALQEGGFLVGGMVSGLLVRGGEHVPVLFNSITCSVEFGERTLIGGKGGFMSASIGRGIGEWLPGRDLDYLDVNAIKASATPTSDQFRDVVDHYRPGFEVPQGEGAHTIQDASPWIIGTHEGMVYSACPFSNWPEEQGFREAGPFAVAMDQAFFDRYHQVWKLDQYTILQHRDHWNDPGFVLPYGIREWPGNGDVSNGEPERLAPFEDLDGDDLYEPEAGEYPLIKGDEAMYSVLHSTQDWSPHPVLPVDLHVMHYAYRGNENEHLRNTVFSNFRIVNRSDMDFADVRFGMFTDFGIGCTDDNAFGCDTMLNLFYAYNWDELDETCQGDLGQGYGEHPPAQGVLFLDRPMTAHTVPWTSALGVEDILTGTQNGDPFMHLGYPSHFMYPDATFGEVGPPLPVPLPGAVGATGPFDLGAGDTLCIDLAFIYARDMEATAYGNTLHLRERAQAVKAWYDAQGMQCTVTPNVVSMEEQRAADELHLFPNPATTFVTLLAGSVIEGVQVLDPQGRIVLLSNDRGLRMDLSVQGLSPGVYLAQVRTAAGRHAERLVVE